MKKKIIIIAVLAIVAVIAATLIKNNSGSKYIQFADENLGKAIAYTAGVEDYTKVTSEDLDKVNSLNLGMPSHYESFEDLKLLKNLGILEFSSDKMVGVASPSVMAISDGIEPKKMSDEQVEEFENKLADVLGECQSLNEIDFFTYEFDDNNEPVVDEDGQANQYLSLKDLSFLQGASNIEILRINYQTQIEDYSYLYNCSNLVYLNIIGSNVEDLEQLKNLSALKDVEVNESQAEELNSLDGISFEVTVEQ